MPIPRYALIETLRLSPSEKAILKAVEARKMAGTAADISRSAGTPRTSTIHTLRKLAKWKLIKEMRNDKHTRWLNNRWLK